ncbi:MAG: DNA mismatch repair endonuclease MutL [Clostridiales bacterium]|nr:DNA mismatch repair endonuclease MutL [Clostridiales bacterium]
MKINRLPSEIFNRIAAGEVVESPSSIVKELVENAIDAGATEITVSVRGGGIDYIRVDDNGSGIEFDDMPTAFMPHATSKIKAIDDLDTISTLGFRGEALPSIAAVADVTMTSRVKDSDMGGEIVYKGGKLVSHEECGAKLGTTVTVVNLFERIPARKKFLNKPSKEEAKILALIEHLVLANADVVFKFDSETKKFASSGEGLKSAIFAVYGDAVLKNTVHASLEEPQLKIEGYTCVPSFTKPSKNYQHVVINGRYVESADIMYAIYSVYAPYLMKRQYPLFVLHLTMPYDMVDVNVHPSKLQVKFADTVMVKSAVARAVKNAIQPRLVDAKHLTDEDFSQEQRVEQQGFGKAAHTIKSFFDIAQKPREEESPSPTFKTTFYSDDVISGSQDNGAQATVSEPKYKDVYDSAASFEEQPVFAPVECKFVGKLFNTYLILERGEMCYFVDQHAAHEKLLYDALLSDYEKKRLKTQPLILPFVFDVSPLDGEAITENLDLLADCGFVVSPFGECTFALSQVPYECAGIDLKNFVSDMLTIVNSRDKSPTALKERLMQAACKAAVKGEIDDLSQSEIDALLSEMAAQNITLFCPHGRPIAVAFGKKEIEKWFKRIV